jgi:hypothetical protein
MTLYVRCPACGPTDPAVSGASQADLVHKIDQHLNVKHGVPLTEPVGSIRASNGGSFTWPGWYVPLNCHS